MKLHNTLTRSVDEISPLENNTVKLYTCGLTVYSQPHIGNWVPYIYWDLLKSTLRHTGFTVIHTQNYTDVGHLVSDDDSGEDKMEKGARQEGTTAWEVAEKYIKIADHEGYELLKLDRPTHLVRATDLIDEQIDFVKVLEEKGYTYVIPNEGVYFDTSKLSDYGKLARLDIAGLQEGARVSTEGKKNITDFALWKFSPKNQKRDMEWESPWGIGFPGWHLECSVIARQTLGDQIDIHTGGIDHIPVHHTNEIAQTEAYTDKQFSKYWVHVNHLKVDGQKMSKSLGNIYTLQDITNKGYELEAFRVFILSKHYRTEGNFTWDNLEAAQNRLHNWKRVAAQIWQPQNAESTQDINGLMKEFIESILNDLNTPAALSALDKAMNGIESNGLTAVTVAEFTRLLELAKQILGVDLFTEDISSEQKAKIATRTEARNSKNWALSDQIRDELLTQGVGLQDATDRTIWYRA